MDVGKTGLFDMNELAEIMQRLGSNPGWRVYRNGRCVRKLDAWSLEEGVTPARVRCLERVVQALIWVAQRRDLSMRVVPRQVVLISSEHSHELPPHHRAGCEAISLTFCPPQLAVLSHQPISPPSPSPMLYVVVFYGVHSAEPHRIPHITANCLTSQRRKRGREETEFIEHNPCEIYDPDIRPPPAKRRDFRGSSQGSLQPYFAY